MIQNEEEFLTLLVDLGVEMTADGENGPVGTELVEFLLGDKDGNPKVRNSGPPFCSSPSVV